MTDLKKVAVGFQNKSAYEVLSEITKMCGMNSVLSALAEISGEDLENWGRSPLESGGVVKIVSGEFPKPFPQWENYAQTEAERCRAESQILNEHGEKVRCVLIIGHGGSHYGNNNSYFSNIND